jgi:hypothetical protein
MFLIALTIAPESKTSLPFCCSIIPSSLRIGPRTCTRPVHRRSVRADRLALVELAADVLHACSPFPCSRRRRSLSPVWRLIFAPSG